MNEQSICKAATTFKFTSSILGNLYYLWTTDANFKGSFKKNCYL